MKDPLIRAAIGSLVRRGILLLFAYFGFERVLTAPEHAALIDWLEAGAMIAVGVVVTAVWSWLSDGKLLKTEPPSEKGLPKWPLD